MARPPTSVDSGIYPHLAASVSSVGIETGMAAFGMGHGFPQPNATDVMAKTAEELDELP